ncbi:s001R [Rabbit fibroma virus]|uniref:Protein T1 n=1 Tax=Rabbit fibroma virus (strain Kasza) TaxID=10272 RepID=VT1_RFVKA|nr:chemokine binding protein [Rabbit fibroma virus]NP_052050.1 chemokine binding protein [Rabbit fibroma virus]P25946.1 RecName: Full=Protein T1; Flags: Precursor [Rabbit fibroma virus (strain Kasza)]AAF17883.1 gp001L [Rabbit fibroma virus]AAF18044.1 s001R [Rabbit fibroma virus]
MRRLCIILLVYVYATFATKGICKQDEDVRYMGIDVVVKVTKKTSGSDTVCQALRTTFEAAHKGDGANDSLSTEYVDDYSEEEEYEYDESFLEGFVIGSTYYTIVGGGLSVTFGFTGCPTVKSVSEYAKGRIVFIRLSSDAPWRDTNPMSINRTEALALLEKCETSIDIKCSNETVSETTYGLASLAPHITQATERGNIIGSTLVDTDCVENLDVTVHLGEMCRKTSDLSKRDSLKVKNGELLDDDTFSIHTPKLKACN